MPVWFILNKVLELVFSLFFPSVLWLEQGTHTIMVLFVTLVVPFGGRLPFVFVVLS